MYQIKIKNDATITIQNIVVAVSLGGKIHIEQAARLIPRSMYKPEQFQGLTHRMIDPQSYWFFPQASLCVLEAGQNKTSTDQLMLCTTC